MQSSSIEKRRPTFFFTNSDATNNSSHHLLLFAGIGLEFLRASVKYLGAHICRRLSQMMQAQTLFVFLSTLAVYTNSEVAQDDSDGQSFIPYSQYSTILYSSLLVFVLAWTFI